MFEKRTTKPTKTNKYYITKSAGGYSTCCLGNSAHRDANLNVLPNCFSGDTKFITRQGLKTLAECEGQTVEILAKDSTWHKAEVKCFGKAELYEVTFSNKHRVLATANHRWIVYKDSQDKEKKYHKEVECTTKELKCSQHYKIPYVYRNYEDPIKFDTNGLIHGFIFGDGSLYQDKKYARISVCSEKKKFILDYIDKKSHNIYYNTNGTIEITKFPKEYKQAPDLTTSSIEYL